MNITAYAPDEPGLDLPDEPEVHVPLDAPPEVVEFLATLDAADLGALRGLIAAARAEGVTDPNTEVRS